MRRIVLTIASTRVTEPLTDFPVYVDLTENDLKTRFNPAQFSFQQRMGANVKNLPYELQSFDQPAGRLRVWVLLPRLNPDADNVFELQYGHASVAATPDAPRVWGNGYKLVFHLESATTIADSRQASPGTPSNLKPAASIDAKLGKGIDFDGELDEWISFTNPITGNGPSTISVWVRQESANNKEALVALGAGMSNQARWLYSQFTNNDVGVGLFDDDWGTTGLNIADAGWKLLHWTYDSKVSRLYRDAQPIGPPSTHTHASNANTQGTQGWLGNSKSANFDPDSGLNGILDEVRIADIARTPGWIAAELANQSEPTVFIAASGPQQLP